MQLGSLVNRTSGLPVEGQSKLINNMKQDALSVLEQFCQRRTTKKRWFCKGLDPTTNLPTGKAFKKAVWEMLMMNYQGAAKKRSDTLNVRFALSYGAHGPLSLCRSMPGPSVATAGTTSVQEDA